MQKLNIQIGSGLSVSIESPDVKELVRLGSFWSELPSECPLCKAAVTLSYRNPQDNEYFGLRCLGSPAHETNFGIYKEHGRGLYYKRDWHEAFGGGGGQPGASYTQPQPSGQNPQYQEQHPTAAAQAAAEGGTDWSPTPKQLAKIQGDSSDLGVNLEELCMQLTGKPSAQMERRDASKIIDHLMAMRDERGQVPQQQYIPPTQPVLAPAPMQAGLPLPLPLPVDDDIPF